MEETKDECIYKGTGRYSRQVIVSSVDHLSLIVIVILTDVVNSNQTAVILVIRTTLFTAADIADVLVVIPNVITTDPAIVTLERRCRSLESDHPSSFQSECSHYRGTISNRLIVGVFATPSHV